MRPDPDGERDAEHERGGHRVPRRTGHHMTRDNGGTADVRRHKPVGYSAIHVLADAHRFGLERTLDGVDVLARSVASKD